MSCTAKAVFGVEEKGKGLEQPCNGIAQTSKAMAKLRQATDLHSKARARQGEDKIG